MSRTTRLNLDDFPDSAYAAELRRGVSCHPFAPELEAQYVRDHLDRVHLRVRLWFTLALCLELFFAVDQILGTGALSWGTLVHLLIMAPSRVALPILVWTPLYERFFMRAARIVVPVSHIAIAVLNVEALVSGRPQQLALFMLWLAGIYSFCGLLYRDSSRTGFAVLAAFIIAAVAFDLPNPMMVSAIIMATVAVAIGAVVHRDAETNDRRAFLEDALVQELVSRDGLTGLLNRRAFDEHMPGLWQHGMRENRSVAILMIDVDHFKGYNDTYGHQAGDSALRSVGNVLKGFARRPLDMAARYGGEEFVVVLYDIPEPYTQYIAEQIRTAVEHLGIPHTASGSGIVTVSIGAAVVRATVGRTPQGAVQYADESLYLAKQEGRNRSVVQKRDDFETQATGSFRKPQLALVKP